MPSRKPLIERFWSKVSKTDDATSCWEWTAAKSPLGYGAIGSGIGKEVELAHRVSYRLANGDFDPALDVCHKCDNPPCVRPDHLFLGTAYDNINDAKNKGRVVTAHLHRQGAAHPKARLTEEQVREIRSSASTGVKCGPLAAKYNTTWPNIWRIVHRETWRHI